MPFPVDRLRTAPRRPLLVLAVVLLLGLALRLTGLDWDDRGRLWVVESFEPVAMRRVTLRIKAKDPAAFKPKLEALLHRQRHEFEIRQMTPEELHYELSWPVIQSTDQLSERIMAMDPSPETEVEITELKPKKA